MFSTSEESIAEILRQLAQQIGNRNITCSAFIDVKHSKIKTITMPRIRSKQLRNLLSQSAFWQEYLGVNNSEWYLSWNKLPTSNFHQIKLILMAVPKTKVQTYQMACRHAGMDLSLVNIACFEFFPYTQQYRRNNCLAMLCGDSPYLISSGDFGLQVNDLSALNHDNHLELEGVARALTQPFGEADMSKPVMVKLIIANAVSKDDWFKISRLLPDYFQVSIHYLPEWIGLADTGTSIFYSRHKKRVNFLNSGKDQSTQYSYSLVSGVCLLALVLSIYLHRVVIEQNKDLNDQVNQYQMLTTAIKNSSKVITRLKQASVWHERLLSSMEDIMLRQKRILQLLVTVEQSLLPGLWLSKIELQSSNLQVRGYAMNDNLVVQYSNKLKQFEDVKRVWIKHLETATKETNKKRKFVIECDLQESRQI